MGVASRAAATAQPATKYRDEWPPTQSLLLRNKDSTAKFQYVQSIQQRVEAELQCPQHSAAAAMLQISIPVRGQNPHASEKTLLQSTFLRHTVDERVSETGIVQP